MPVAYVLGTNKQEVTAKQRILHTCYFLFLGTAKSLMVLGKKRLALEWEASSFFRPGHRLDHLLRYKQRDSTLRLSWFHVIV
jgi:hypothetical protein